MPRDWSTKTGTLNSGVESNFKRQWKEIIDQHYASPAIVVWTPFNESWGQHRTAEIVDYTRGLDATRLIDAASGGNHFAGVGDMIDLHDYDNPPHIFMYDPEKPVVLGEYGGLGRNIEGHRWYDRNTTNYSDHNTETKLTNAYVERVNSVKALSQNSFAEDGNPAAYGAAVYTQIIDVETEVNGLFTYDRAILKVDEAKVREANLSLTNLFGEEPNGIQTINSRPLTNDSYYDLQGRKIDNRKSGDRPLSKGIYINKGRVVVVK